MSRFLVLDRALRELGSALCPLDALVMMKANPVAECTVRESDGEVIAWRHQVDAMSLARWYVRLGRSVW